MNDTNTVVYSKDNCPYCVQAKRLLATKGIAFEEIDVMAGSDEDITATKAALVERVLAAGGEEPRTLPQIFLEGEYVGGFKELNERLR